MKKQWRKFLKENESNWSYGIVPAMVDHLDQAIQRGDAKAVRQVLDCLAAQGVTLTKAGNLYFVTDIFR